ncbi:hypothetical protein ACSDR0_25190 [Streptosporangium sp. G11]|uniref:hypothetical protein n=1 Tax=Streptosporangium sp. G11 TaxID=3436926 RepID=UPI003EBEC68E
MSTAGDGEATERLATAFDQQDADELRKAVRILVARHRLTGFRPYWHALGFFRIELAQDSEGRRYALHCWPERERHTQDPAWLVHSHAWDLESTILSGSIRDLQYENLPEEAGDLAGPLYLASAVHMASSLRRTETVLSLAGEEDSSLREGEFYTVPLARYHQSIVAGSDFCMTLMRRGDRIRQNARVLGEFGFAEELVYRREMVSLPLVDLCFGRI